MANQFSALDGSLRGIKALDKLYPLKAKNPVRDYNIFGFRLEFVEGASKVDIPFLGRPVDGAVAKVSGDLRTRRIEKGKVTMELTPYEDGLKFDMDDIQNNIFENYSPTTAPVITNLGQLKNEIANYFSISQRIAIYRRLFLAMPNKVYTSAGTDVYGNAYAAFDVDNRYGAGKASGFYDILFREVTAGNKGS